MGADDSNSGEIPEPEGEIGMSSLREWIVIVRLFDGMVNKCRKCGPCSTVPT